MPQQSMSPGPDSRPWEYEITILAVVGNLWCPWSNGSLRQENKHGTYFIISLRMVQNWEQKLPNFGAAILVF